MNCNHTLTSFISGQVVEEREESSGKEEWNLHAIGRRGRGGEVGHTVSDQGRKEAMVGGSSCGLDDGTEPVVGEEGVTVNALPQAPFLALNPIHSVGSHNSTDSIEQAALLNQRVDSSGLQ